VHEDIATFPIWSVPEVNTGFTRWFEEKWRIEQEKYEAEVKVAGASGRGEVERGGKRTRKQKSQSALENAMRRTPIVEDAQVQTGLYRGDRDTEPRAATVIHLVIDRDLEHDHAKGPQPLDRPLDVFVVNVHLTTLTEERVGIPEVDSRAAERRVAQLRTILDDTVSPYMRWVRNQFEIKGAHVETIPQVETHRRFRPIWLLAGDFNFTPSAEEHAYLEARNFIDLDREHQVHTKASGTGEDPSITLDYVFAGPAFEALDPRDTRANVKVSTRTDELVRVSDHYPLIVELPIWPRKAKGECPGCRVATGSGK
jgi:hypothetical protein